MEGFRGGCEEEVVEEDEGEEEGRRWRRREKGGEGVWILGCWLSVNQTFGKWKPRANRFRTEDRKYLCFLWKNKTSAQWDFLSGCSHTLFQPFHHGPCS